MLDDPFINDEHVKFLDIANEQIAYIKEETRRIMVLKIGLHSGLRLIDFKLEFDFDRTDYLGRWNSHQITAASGMLKNHMDKDVFRREIWSSLTDVYQVVLEKLQGLSNARRKTFVFDNMFE